MSRTDRTVAVLLTLALVATPAWIAWALYGPAYAVLVGTAALVVLYAIGRTFPRRRGSSTPTRG